MTTALNYFDQLAGDYENQFSDSSVWAIAHRVGYRLLAEYLQPFPERVADIGCGTGKWGRLFSRRGASTLFSDVSPEMLEQALALAQEEGAKPDRLSGAVRSVDALADVGRNEFDLTLCMGDPLSYCGRPREGISELVRITRPGKLIFVSVDSRLGYLRIFKERLGYDLARLRQFCDDGEIIGWEDLPLHAFDAAELDAAFASAGAERLGIWQLPVLSAYFLFDPAFVARLKEPKFRDELDELELSAVKRGATSSGTHHLYGLFRKASA